MTERSPKERNTQTGFRRTSTFTSDLMLDQGQINDNIKPRFRSIHAKQRVPKGNIKQIL